MRQKLLSLRQIAVSVLTIGVFLALHSLNLNAQNSQGDNFVYVMSNKNPGNSIIQFRRASNGSLTWVREVATGGNGSGANGADPLGSQDSLVLGGDGLRLVAVNAGSNEVSVFGTIAGRLTWLSKSSSGGVFPNSVALSGDLVYVLNKNGATPNITGFRLDTSGTLHWIATVPLPPGSAGANDVRFSPDGTRLLLTESGTNEILVFPIASDGVASSPVVQASAGGSPFGIRFGHDGIVVVSEAAGSASSLRRWGHARSNQRRSERHAEGILLDLSHPCRQLRLSIEHWEWDSFLIPGGQPRRTGFGERGGCEPGWHPDRLLVIPRQPFLVCFGLGAGKSSVLCS